MADIVVLYAHEDREKVRLLHSVLCNTAQQWSIWWDRDIAHGAWEAEAERQITRARCVLAFWSSASVRESSIVRKEAAFARRHRVPLLHIFLEHVDLPMSFYNEVFTDLTGWQYQPAAPGFQDLIRRVSSTLAATSALIGRPESFIANGKTLQLPSFVRSVSSYETLLSPRYSLLALALHPSSEPILVSTYDLLRSPGIDRTDISQRVSEIADRGAAVFVDSGNYEAFRKGERSQLQSGDSGASWAARDFHNALQEISGDLVLSYDDPFPVGKPVEIARAVARQVAIDEKKSRGTQIIPVVHAPLVTDKRRPEELPEIIESLVKEIDCSIVAIPERELGDGVITRAKSVQNVRAVMNSSTRYRAIHLLGTGNPITLAVLAAVGADVFDGLEWCRTAIDHDTALLHHPQHFDFFMDQCKFSEFEGVRTFTSDRTRDFRLRLLVHNLDFFHRWITDFRSYVERGQVKEFLGMYLSEQIMAKLESSLSGVIK